MNGTLTILTRAEFFKMNPPETRGILIQSEGLPDKFIPIGDEIICDLCNAEITGDVGMFDNYALCESCVKNTVSQILKQK